MGSIVNAIIKQLIHIFTGGFVSSITSVEIWLFLRIDKFIVHGSLISLSSGWFYQFFQKMEVLALALILPLFIIGIKVIHVTHLSTQSTCALVDRWK